MPLKLTDKLERPPANIYAACEEKFGVSRFRGVIWTVGEFLYNPDGVPISPWLRAHEQVHSDRQQNSGDIDAWWTNYLERKQFRFEEELEAHKEEWKVIQHEIPVRQQRRQELRFICTRLSGGLYGNLCTAAEARRMITGRGDE